VIDELINSPEEYLGRQVTPPFTAQRTFDDDRLKCEFAYAGRDVPAAFFAGDDERLAC